MSSFPVTMTRYRRHLVYLLGAPVRSDASPRLIQAFPSRGSRTGHELPIVSP
jgi:hypothetical protein